MNIYVVTYTDFTGSTSVAGAFTKLDDAAEEKRRIRELSDAVEQAWEARMNWKPSISEVAKLARGGASDAEIEASVHRPEAHPEHPFAAIEVIIHEVDVT